MKKILSLLCVFIMGLAANAAITADQALSFFNKYVNAANTYQDDLTSYYAPNAKIIRVVVKPDNSKVTLTTDTDVYFNQMRLSANVAKMRKYKNFYTDRKVTKVGNDYKISCLRQPSTSDYKIPAYFVIGQDSKGNLKIKEEMMYSKNQLLLKAQKK